MSNAGVILALNSGSSSLKLGCYTPATPGGEDLVLSGTAEGIGQQSGSLHLRDAQGATLLEQQHVSETHSEAFVKLASALRAHLPAQPVAIGHRVVHGGPALRDHQRITPPVLETLRAATHLAPLHIPSALDLIQQATEFYPQVPQFACFDTTFHRTMPARATHLPVPLRYFEQGVQRYGFHGLSCESVLRRIGTPVPPHLVIAHLGGGSSVTAVQDGKSVDTTMGLSPTGGVPMSTRCGDLDPEVLLYLLRDGHLQPEQMEAFVNHDCGLAGLAGGEADMQELLARETQGDEQATLAIDVFCTALRKTIGGYAALLGGLDLLIFTGGIGSNSASIRGRVTDGLDFVFRSRSGSRTLAIVAQEEEEIARISRRLLADEGSRQAETATTPK